MVLELDFSQVLVEFVCEIVAFGLLGADCLHPVLPVYPKFIVEAEVIVFMAGAPHASDHHRALDVDVRRGWGDVAVYVRGILCTGCFDSDGFVSPNGFFAE